MKDFFTLFKYNLNRAKDGILLGAVFFALARTLIEPRLTHIPSVEGFYEAFVHMFVGFLVALPFYDPEEKLGPTKLYGVIGWALALWELGWFIVQKFF